MNERHYILLNTLDEDLREYYSNREPGTYDINIALNIQLNRNLAQCNKLLKKLQPSENNANQSKQS